MAQELIYTSFPKGVKPGVSGFCTVAASPDLAPNMISRLEGLSGYRHLYMPGTPEADYNPANWSHVVINVGNAESHVVYRVADAGLDYTGRSNKLAHFIVLDKSELVPCGPAAMLTTPGLIDLAFDEQVGTRPFTRPIPRQLASARPCMAWGQAAGDPGWAGELAKTAWTGKYACIVYKPGMNVLALIKEAMALLPPDRRWKTTFSTYYSKLPTGIDCQWRCVVAGTPEAAQAIAEVGSGLVIDLSNGTLAPAPDSPAVAAARAGRTIPAPAGATTVTTATRQRPAQTARSAAEAAVTADIQAELQARDSAGAKSAEDDMFSQMDSLEWSAPRKKTRPSSGVRYGLYTAIIAGVVLLGVIVATVFVMSNNSSKTGQKTVASIDDSSSDSLLEQSIDAPNPDEDAAVSDEQQQKAEEQARLEAEAKAKQEAEEKARLEAAEKAKKEAEAKQKEEKEKAQQEAEKARQKKEAEEKVRLAELAKAKKETEEKIFNDPRWIGTDRKQYFIYVDSNDVPDCTRLNLQLQKQKLQIVKLELVQLLKEDSGFPGFELKLDSADSSKYIVYNNDNSTEIVIQLNGINDEKAADNSSDTPELEKETENILIMGGGSLEFRDFAQQNVLLATFSDNAQRVISFFKEDKADGGKLLSKSVLSPLFDKRQPFQLTVPADIPDKKTCLISEIKVVQNSKESFIVDNKEYEIKTVMDKDGFKIIVFGINHTLVEEIKGGVTPERNETPIEDFAICFDKAHALDKIYVKYRFKKERETLSDAYSNRCLTNEEFSSFIKKIVNGMIREQLFYMDVSIQESKLNGHASFLWKRIYLSPPEESKK
ncbi:MAG: cell envelope integrity protein TolA [Thermoguttaceae bacterium]|nr:cell envelope integrity protein TolA [Thermoguttaceae bacterium]